MIGYVPGKCDYQILFKFLNSLGIPIASSEQVVSASSKRNQEKLASFTCKEGLLLISEIYLGKEINKLSVLGITREGSSFIFSGKGIGNSLSQIRTTREFTSIVVAGGSIILHQEGFENSFQAEVNPFIDGYSRLTEFLQSTGIPFSEVKTAFSRISQAQQSETTLRQAKFSIFWNWLSDNHASNISICKRIISQQNIQKPILAELASFSLSTCLEQAFGNLKGLDEVRYGADLSEMPEVRSAVNHHGLSKLKGLKPFFWYNDSIIRRRRGILIFNRGVSLHSFFKKPVLFFFGRLDTRLSENIAISDVSERLEISLHGHTSASAEPERHSYIITSPLQNQRSIIASGLLQFIIDLDAYAFNRTRLRVSFAQELRCAIPDGSLPPNIKWRAYSPIDKQSSLDDCSRGLLYLAELIPPNDEDLIFSLTTSLPGPETLVLVSINGLFAVQKTGLRLAKGMFFEWSSLHWLEHHSPGSGIHCLQINQGINAFTIRLTHADGSKEKLEEIARFVMSLKVRLLPIVRL
jgi:hypothetical protein